LYKETSQSHQEFVVAELSNSSALVVERRLAPREQSISTLSASSPSPSTSIDLAYDTVQLFSPTSNKFTSRLASTPAEKIGHYAFNSFPVLEFARLVNVMSKQKPQYVLDTSISYWYASTIVAISVAEFGDGTIDSTPSRLVGSWNGHKLMIRVEDIEVMRNAYVQARAADPEPIGPIEAKYRRQLKTWETEAKDEDAKLKELEELRQQDRAKLKELEELRQQDRAKLKESQQEIEELRRALQKVSGLAGQ
jgi:hypothetical protein